MDKKLSIVCLKKLSFLSKSKDIVPAGTPVKDWGIDIERMLFVLLNLWINTMVACVIEELSFKRKVKVVSASDVALKPLMDRLKRSVPPPHIISVAMV